MDGRKIKELSIEGILHRGEPTKHFVYSVRVTWSDGMVNVVYRRYKQFLELKNQLLEAFPNKTRVIPTLEAKCPNSATTALKCVDEIAFFVETLINLPAYISSCALVLDLFTLTEQDLTSITQKGEKNSKKTPKKPNGINTKKNKSKNRKWTRFTRRKKTLKGDVISAPLSFEQYTVLEAYKKQNKSDVNLTEGQVVEVIEKCENGWWYVEADEKLGWAPASFLQNADQDEEDDFIIARCSRGKGDMYMTTKSYKANMEDELSFAIGVNLQIVERNYCGWWRAVYMEQEGYVPAAYLKKIGASRHSVMQRNTKEKQLSIASTLAESRRQDESDRGANVRISLGGSIQRMISDPEGQNLTTAKHLTLPHQGKPVTFSEEIMESDGKKDQVDVNRNMKKVSFSGCEGDTTLPNAKRESLSSIKESDETSSEEDAVCTIDTSGLSDNPQQNRETFLAIASYEGDEESDKLTFTEGEIVKVIQKEDSGWWLGLAHRQTGWVPSNYLKPLTHDSETRDQIMSDTKAEAEKSDYQTREVSLLESEVNNGEQTDEDAVCTTDISGLSDNPQQNRETFLAIASYEGDDDSDELVLTGGEIVEIILKKDSGWWLGLAHRQIGWVPSNYLKPLTHASETRDQIPSDTKTETEDVDETSL